MNKSIHVLISVITIYASILPHLKAQSNCEDITTSLEQAAQKHEKFGALTILGKSEAMVRTMGRSAAHHKGMALMSQAITAYMQTRLQDELVYANDEQQERFAVRLLGKPEKGNTSISGRQYSSSNALVSLNLFGVREVMSNECPSENGGSGSYYKLLAISPEGIAQTIDEAIVSFAEKEENSGQALIDSWQQSELRASLQEQQKKYEKKMR